ncbi:MAG: spore coat associated protein CotJA [Ruminiclostridium sp.]|nr:spore coat associated protein CotJA [Ruminiclostridium sp.]
MYNQPQTQAECRCGNDRRGEPRIGYSYVPFQECVGKVYSPQKALAEGTIFPELNITINEYERGLYNGK